MRVLWLIRGLGPGGAERLLLAQARAAGPDVRYEVAYQVAAKDHLVGDLVDAGVDVHLLPTGPGWPLALRRLVADRGIEVVHAHAPAMAVGARLGLRLLPGGPRPRLIYTEHNRWQAYRPSTRWANAATFAIDDRTISVSEEARRSVLAPLRGRVEALHHGIDRDELEARAGDRASTRAELGVGTDEVLLAHVANYRREKAHEVLIDAMAELASSRPEVRVVMVGQGQRWDEVARHLATRDLGDRIQMLGFREDVAAIVAASDALVLSSDHEGLPVAVMEALTLGVPVIATAVGGIPEAVDDGVEGLLVPPRDPVALAGAIERLAEDPELRARLGRAARRRSEAFDAATVTRHIEGAYAALLGRPGGGSGAGQDRAPR